MSLVMGAITCGLPHVLLAAEKNAGWLKLRKAFEQLRADIEATDADLLILYSTYWPSVIGHQIQARPQAEWVHVDDQFHELGSIPYNFYFDQNFAEAYCECAKQRGLQARTINYHGFPIDTGSVVALKLLNPKNRLPAVIVSSNVYSDRAETVVLGKAARDAVQAQGRKAVAIAITSLSNRLFTEDVPPEQDHIHSKKDDEWNRKYLEFLGQGRLEDVEQLSRQFHAEARVHKVTSFKPFWWLSAVMGQNNLYTGKVYEYQPVLGTGNAVVGLTPSPQVAKDLEFDEDNTEFYQGDRNVLDAQVEASSNESASEENLPE